MAREKRALPSFHLRFSSLCHFYFDYSDYYGHSAPAVFGYNAKHCLNFSRSDPISTSKTLMTDSICSFKDDRSQLLNFSMNTYSAQAGFLGHKDETIQGYYIAVSDSGCGFISTQPLEQPQRELKLTLSG